ncbi:hypothetical protein BH10ACT2_BH10ACT2_18970 [soil metagenome]
MIVARVAVAAAGAVVVLWTLSSAIKTVVLPRASASVLTRLHFRSIRVVFDRLASPKRSFSQRDGVMALYAPISLVMLPGVWVLLMIVGFTAIFWGTGIDPLREAFYTSGSSLLTLGFVRPVGLGRVALTFLEAGIGLGIVSLMISYLPTIYGAFSRREALVGMLEVRAGLPPSAAELLRRYQVIGWMNNIDADLFEPWERWFVDVEESHTTQPSLVFFRSPHPERNWLTAAGCVLDTAAIVASTLDIPRNAQRDILLRTGYFTLRRIADFYGIAYDPSPAATDPISVSQREFDLLCVELRAAGLPLKPNLQQAWLDYAGWRVNYDSVLVALCALVMAPPARWSSDRMPDRHFTPPWFPARASYR